MPFKKLFRTISILFIDDDPELLLLYKDIIKDHPLYNGMFASNADQAQNIIQNDKPHFCVLDLGINDIDQDEFYLIKKFSPRIPFIIISGSMDMERAFKATRLGAAGMIAKPPEFTLSKFWDTLADVFCNSVITPGLPANANQQLKICCEAIKTVLPESVSEWAANVNISESYLRKLWSECFTTSPKYMLAKYKMYYHALRYHNAAYLAENNQEEIPVIPKSQISEFRHLVKCCINEIQL